MPADYFDNLMSKFAGAKTNNSYARTQDGYYVIPVNGNYDGYGFGVTSFIAYIKGSVAIPDIPLIIEVTPTSENIVDEVIIYEKQRKSSNYNESIQFIQAYFGSETFSEYDRRNYDDYREYKSKSELAPSGRGGRKSNNNVREWIFLDEDNSDVGEGGKKYSDRDQSVKTDREILLDALESAVQNEDEECCFVPTVARRNTLKLQKQE